MHRFQKILCYVGDAVESSSALDTAAALAERSGAHVTVIDVLSQSTEGPWLTLSDRPELDESLLAARRSELSAMVARLAERDISAVPEVATGSPFVELIRRVAVDGHDLVIKTAQAADTAHGWALGTTALHLIRKCPAPVWIVEPESREIRGRVLVALDPKLDGAGNDPMSQRLLDAAAALARAHEAKLDILHAWWLYSEATLRGPSIRMPAREVDALLEEVRDGAEAALGAVVERAALGSIESEVHLVKGQPDRVVARFASESDVVVMGTHAVGGTHGVLIGNTAERILQRVSCSVFAMKPEDFASPLRFDGAGTAERA